MAHTENDMLVGPVLLANAVATIALDFYFAANADLEVYKNGSDTPLVLDTDYTVTGAGTSSGQITLATPADGTDYYCVLWADTIERTSNIGSRGGFTASMFNNAQDQVYRHLARLRTMLDRALLIEPTSDAPATSIGRAADRAGKVIAFSSDGLTLEASDAGGVDSVNGETGAVTLDADDIDDTSTSHKFATAAQLSKIDASESGATADQSDAEIETAYNNQVPQVSGGEITAGTETAVRRFSPDDVEAMIQQHAPGSSGGDAWSDAVDADIVPDADGTRDLGSSSNRFANAHVDSLDLNGTTINSLEDGADVTDTANVTVAGALMDSELADISAVKALDQGVATTDSPQFAGVNVGHASDTTITRVSAGIIAVEGNTVLLGTSLGVTVQPYDADTVLSDTDDTITAAMVTTSVDDGTKSSGTYTPNPSGGHSRRIVNGGAFTLAAPTFTGDFYMAVHVTNNGSAGTITFSGFAITPGGDALTTTNADEFILRIEKIHDVVTCNIEALQ